MVARAVQFGRVGDHAVGATGALALGVRMRGGVGGAVPAEALGDGVGDEDGAPGLAELASELLRDVVDPGRDDGGAQQRREACGGADSERREEGARDGKRDGRVGVGRPPF